jgi:hypothetical protein
MQPACLLILAEMISSTLKMEAICSFETSVTTQRTTRPHIPEDDTLYNHRCENLKSYIVHVSCKHFIHYRHLRYQLSALCHNMIIFQIFYRHTDHRPMTAALLLILDLLRCPLLLSISGAGPPVWAILPVQCGSSADTRAECFLLSGLRFRFCTDMMQLSCRRYLNSNARRDRAVIIIICCWRCRGW